MLRQALAIGLSLTLWAAPGQAFRTLAEELGEDAVVRWPSSEIRLFYSDAGAPMATEVALSEVAGALVSWNPACSSARLSLVDELGGEPGPGDHVNSISWVREGWEQAGWDPAAPAITDVQVLRSDEQVEIDEADIYLNAEHFTWGEGEDDLRLAPIVLHELGHVLGLAHPCELGGTEALPDCDADEHFDGVVMHPAHSAGRDELSADDVEGLCSLYPVDSAALECSSDDDCGPALTCHEKSCIRGSGGPGYPCTSARECASAVCEEQCQRECSDDSDCPSGGLCEASDEGFRGCVSDGAQFGAECTAAGECTSELCLIRDGEKGQCSVTCSDSDACPEGWTCSEVEDASVCVPPQAEAETDASCSVARRPALSFDGGVMMGALGLWLWARSRARQLKGP